MPQKQVEALGRAERKLEAEAQAEEEEARRRLGQQAVAAGAVR